MDLHYENITCSNNHTELRVFFTAVPCGHCTGEIVFFFNEKILVLEEIGFSKKNPYKENPFLMYEPCVVVCEDFDFIKVSLCV